MARYALPPANARSPPTNPGRAFKLLPTATDPARVQLISIVPPLDPVNYDTVASALQAYVNVSAHLDAVDRWQHYRRAYERVAQYIGSRIIDLDSPSAASPAAVEEAAEAAERDLLRFALPDRIGEGENVTVGSAPWCAHGVKSLMCSFASDWVLSAYLSPALALLLPSL